MLHGAAIAKSLLLAVSRSRAPHSASLGSPNTGPNLQAVRVVQCRHNETTSPPHFPGPASPVAGVMPSDFLAGRLQVPEQADAASSSRLRSQGPDKERRSHGGSLRTACAGLTDTVRSASHRVVVPPGSK